MSQSTDKDEKDADEIGLVYDKKDKDNSSKLEEQKFKYENLRRIIKDKVKAFNKESIVMMGKQMFGKQIKGDLSRIIEDDKTLDNIVT